MQFHIDNMTCGGCARSVTRAIQSIDPEAVVTTDPSTRRVEVESSRSRDDFVCALDEAGFAPR
jgi:copper chaperone